MSRNDPEVLKGHLSAHKDEQKKKKKTERKPCGVTGQDVRMDWAGELQYRVKTWRRDLPDLWSTTRKPALLEV